MLKRSDERIDVAYTVELFDSDGRRDVARINGNNWEELSQIAEIWLRGNADRRATLRAFSTATWTLSLSETR